MVWEKGENKDKEMKQKYRHAINFFLIGWMAHIVFDGIDLVFTIPILFLVTLAGTLNLLIKRMP